MCFISISQYIYNINTKAIISADITPKISCSIAPSMKLAIRAAAKTTMIINGRAAKTTIFKNILIKSFICPYLIIYINIGNCSIEMYLIMIGVGYRSRYILNHINYIFIKIYIIFLVFCFACLASYNQLTCGII